MPPCYRKHDYLKDLIGHHANFHLNLQFRSSMDSLAALSRGECLLAGFHVSEDRAPGTLAQKAFKKCLKAGKHKLINFVTRRQGLMVAALNPKGISGIADLKRGDVRFVNRQRGSGTRLEVDQWLQQERIAPVTVAGYDNVETTHLAVAAAIASGTADAGVGIQAAAAQFGLDFMPLAQEQYYLVCLKETLELPAVVRLRELLQRGDWKEAMRSLPGHDTTAAGEVVALRAAMPWYAFRKPES